MSKTKGRRARRRQKEGPMPFAGAGLIRFFQDETPGVKVGPVTTLVIALILIIGVGIAHLFI